MSLHERWKTTATLQSEHKIPDRHAVLSSPFLARLSSQLSWCTATNKMRSTLCCVRTLCCVNRIVTCRACGRSPHTSELHQHSGCCSGEWNYDSNHITSAATCRQSVNLLTHSQWRPTVANWDGVISAVCNAGRTVHQSSGVRLARNDFGVVFGSVFQKTAVFGLVSVSLN